MPQFLEDKLRAEYSHASKTGNRPALRGKRLNAAIFGTMNKLGAVKGNKITAKGRAMERKHERAQTLGDLVKSR